MKQEQKLYNLLQAFRRIEADDGFGHLVEDGNYLYDITDSEAWSKLFSFLAKQGLIREELAIYCCNGEDYNYAIKDIKEE